MRGRGDHWFSVGGGIVWALVLAVLLCAGSARAQTFSPTGLQWSVGPGSSAATASLSGTNLAIAQSLAVTAAIYGVTKVWPAGRLVTTGATVLAPAFRSILQSQMARGALTGSALVAATLLAGGGATYDPVANSFSSPQGANKPNGSTVDLNTSGWSALNTGPFTSTAGQLAASSCAGPTYTVNSVVLQSNNKDAYVYCTRVSDGAKILATPIFEAAGTTYHDPSYPSGPSTNAQIENAIAATPSAFVPLWMVGGCDQKTNTYVDISGMTAWNDPCAAVLVGGTPGAATFPNGNTYTWPAQTRTTAVAGGNTTTSTLTTSATLSANTGADQKTNPVAVQAATQDAEAVTNASGTTTTTTTTTTNQTKSDTQPQTTSALFNAGTATLYTKKTQTWGGVLNNFVNTVKGAPWYTAMSGFFNVTIASSGCPHWAVPATKWTPTLDSSVYFCSSTATTTYQIAGAVVLAVAAWAAFKIAFL